MAFLRASSRLGSALVLGFGFKLLFSSVEVNTYGLVACCTLCQAVQVELLHRSGVLDRQMLLRGMYYPQVLSKNSMALLPYIDEVGVLGTSALAVNSLHGRLRKEMGSSCLPNHVSKEHPAEDSQLKADCLGLELHRFGVVRPKRK